MRYIRYTTMALMLGLSACASTPPAAPTLSAAEANIMAHRMAQNELPASAARMSLAIQRYQENETIDPVKMHTTDTASGE